MGFNIDFISANHEKSKNRSTDINPDFLLVKTGPNLPPRVNYYHD